MAVTISGTTGLAVPLGSASAPGVSNTTSATTGLYNPTSTTIAIATNGVAAVTVDASQNVTAAANLTLSGTAARITGDFSTGTYINRVMFQTSTANGNTAVGAIPNGTSTTSSFVAFNNSDPTNASLLNIQCLSTEARVISGSTGTGTSLPMTFYTGGSERMRVDTSGNLNIATTGVAAKLYVNGNAASVISALTDGTTITPDFSVANNFSVTLGGNRTLANPTNLTPGQSGIIYVSQDATGSRTLAYGAYWKFPNGNAPTLTTTASATDALVYVVRTSTSITVNSILNIG